MMRYADWFQIYKLTPRRRIFAMADLRSRALELGLTAIAERAARGIEHDTATAEMELLRRPEARNSYGENAPDMDKHVDRCVSSSDGYLLVQIQSFPATHPRHQAAQRVRTRLFPQGVNAVTSLPFAEEHIEVNNLLKRFAAPELAADIALLPDLPALMDNLREQNVEYGKSLGEYLRVPSMDEVRAARDHGQELMLETLVLVLAHFIDAPADDPKRAYLLEPIARQHREIAKARSRRRAPGDVTLPDDMESPDDPLDLPGDAPESEQPTA